MSVNQSALAKVPTMAVRQNLLSAKVAKAKAAKAEAKRIERKAARWDAKAAKAADGQRHELRAAAIKALVGGTQASVIYSKALAKAFPKFWEFKREEGKAKTNHGVMVAAYFAEVDLFAENFKAAHLAAGKPGRANPSAYIANFKKYAEAEANPNAKGNGSGNVLAPMDAIKRDLPALFLRVNNDDAFADNAKLQEVSDLMEQVLKLVGANLGEIKKKIGK
jgi:hypothetical protein